MLKKIKSKDSRLVFLYFGSIADLNMLVFTDDSSVSLRNGSSSAGDCVILLCGKENKAIVFQLKRVVKSTTAAESLTLVLGLEKCIYLLRALIWHLTSS